MKLESTEPRLFACHAPVPGGSGFLHVPRKWRCPTRRHRRPSCRWTLGDLHESKTHHELQYTEHNRRLGETNSPLGLERVFISYASVKHRTNLRPLSHVGHYSFHNQSSSRYTSMRRMIHNVFGLGNYPRLVTADYRVHTLSRWVYILFPVPILALNIPFD